MSKPIESYDALIVGGGFYGCSIASYLHHVFGRKKVLIVEREDALLQRASFNNQARIHNGYHYPRSFTTAFRSRINLQPFYKKYLDCVDQTFTKIYAIARKKSKVTARQFERFCHSIGAVLRKPSPKVASYFSKDLIEAVFEVEESAFNASILATQMKQELDAPGIDIWFESIVKAIHEQPSGPMEVTISREGVQQKVKAPLIFNCTYAGLDSIEGDFGALRATLKYEIAEIGLVQLPDELACLGITVMDGPFFSTMPFPAYKLHSLSHVRYTPHLFWTSDEHPELDPYKVMDAYHKRSQVEYMIRDASRYIPMMKEATFQKTLFEVKVVLMANEIDDGRPILFEPHRTIPGVYSVLGGKIDNIFDVFEAVSKLPELSE